MLTIHGRASRMCDGVSRRGFLKIGGLGVTAGCLSLADIFRAEAAAGRTSGHKAVINIFLGGGPPHQDMWEIKTEAPKEIKGEFKPIATKVPGIQIGEVFTRIAEEGIRARGLDERRAMPQSRRADRVRRANRDGRGAAGMSRVKVTVTDEP